MSIVPECLPSLTGAHVEVRKIEGEDVRIKTLLAWRSDPSPIVSDFVALAQDGGIADV